MYFHKIGNTNTSYKLLSYKVPSLKLTAPLFCRPEGGGGGISTQLCPDVCVEKGKTLVLFGPQVSEMSDLTQNGCEICHLTQYG